MYVGNEEIKSYFKGFASKYNLWQYINMNREIVHAEWQEDPGQWSIQVKDVVTGSVTEHTCDIFINGSGILNNWRWPDIPRLGNFKGKLLHSANYDEKFDLRNKVVGLIGNG